MRNLRPDRYQPVRSEPITVGSRYGTGYSLSADVERGHSSQALRLERQYIAEKARADQAAAEVATANARADQAEARSQRLEDELRQKEATCQVVRNALRQAEARCQQLEDQLRQTKDRCQQLDNRLREANDRCHWLEDRLVPSLVLTNEQMCSFKEVIEPCLRARPTISRPVRCIVLEDGYLVHDHQRRNLESVLRHLTATVFGLRFVVVRTKPPSACGDVADEMETTAHMRKLREMFFRVKKPSQVIFKLKYIDAMHDRKMMFDNGWAVHMGKGLDFIRHKGKVVPSKEYASHDVGEASINFFYSWDEDVVNYVEAIVQRGVDEFDLVV